MPTTPNVPPLPTTEPERTILEVLAVTYDPVTISELAPLLSALGHRDSTRRVWNSATLRPVVDRMVKSGLVHERGRVDCVAPLREPIARELVRRGEFARIAAVVEQRLPAGAGSLCRSAEMAIRQFRFAYYGRDPSVPWYGARGALETPAEAWDTWTAICACRPLLAVGGDLEDAWVASLSLPLLDRLGIEVYGSRHHELATARVKLRAAMHAHIRTGAASTTLRVAWGYDLFWRGQPDEAVTAVVGLDVPAALLLRAWAATARGAFEEARVAFEQANARMQKERSATDELSALFFACVLLGTGTAEAIARARGYLQRSECNASVACRELLVVAGHLSTGARPPEHEWRSGPLPADASLLFEALARVWTNRPIGPETKAKLKEIRTQAAQAEHGWLVGQIAGLLDASVPSDRSAPLLRDLVRPHAPWRLKLDALAKLRAPPAAAATIVPIAPARSLRMAWALTLHPSGLLFAPREQKLTGSGWTRGRPIALKRLHDNLNDYDYVSDQDRRILTTIHRESSRYNGYEDVTYAFRESAALAAMVGHPLLVWSDDGSPIRLGRGEPRLVIERVGEQIVVRLDPHSRAEWAVRQVARDALELVTLTDTHRNIATILEGELSMPATAEADLRGIVEHLAGVIPVQANIRGWGARSVTADATPRVQLAPAGAGLTMRLVVRPVGAEGPVFPLGDGPSTVVTRVHDEMVQAERDIPAERRVVDDLLSLCPSIVRGTLDGFDWSFGEEESALALLLDIQALGDRVVVEWPANVPVRRVRALDPATFHLRVQQDGDWFAASGSLVFDDELTIELTHLLTLLDASPGRFVALGEGRFLALTEELRARLDVLRRLGQRGPRRADALRVHPSLAPLVDDLSADCALDGDSAFRTLIDRIAAGDAADPAVPSTLAGELRPYQLDGFRWLARLADRGAGACLADDMGLGKTLQALAVLVRRAADGPALVVAPTSVCAGWIEEARRFAPTLDVRRFGPGDRGAALLDAGPFTVLVCSYGILQSEAERLAATHWHTLVLDEAQQIKNSATQRFKAATGLHADFRMACSGTPIENHLGELWSLLHFLNPGLLGTEPAFRKMFQLPIERERDSAEARRASSALRRVVRPFILRRTKSEVLQDLPSRTEVTLHVELGSEEAALYEALRRRALEAVADAVDRGPGWRFRVLAEITRLRQAACNARLVLDDAGVLFEGPTPPRSAKLAALADLVDSLREGGHKALIFSQFVRHLEIVRNLLQERQIPFQYLDGGCSAPDRARAVRAFQSGEGDVFLISLRAGGTGLNLTAADYVIHLDPWWNPAVEDQASDRAHRIGQQRPVTIYRLVSTGTIEERIVALHHAKRDLASSLLEGADGRISAEELVSLLEGPEVVEPGQVGDWVLANPTGSGFRRS